MVTGADFQSFYTHHSWDKYMEHRAHSSPNVLPEHVVPPSNDHAQVMADDHPELGHELFCIPEGTPTTIPPHLWFALIQSMHLGCNENQIMFTNERLLVGTIIPLVQSCNPNRDLPLLHGLICHGQQGVAINGDSTYKVGDEVARLTGRLNASIYETYG